MFPAQLSQFLLLLPHRLPSPSSFSSSWIWTVPPLSCVMLAVRSYISSLAAQQFDQRAKNERRLTTSAAQCAVASDLSTLLLTQWSIQWMVNFSEALAFKTGTDLLSLLPRKHARFQNMGAWNITFKVRGKLQMTSGLFCQLSDHKDSDC